MIYNQNIHFSSKGVTFTDKMGHPLSLSQTYHKAINRVYNWFLDLKLYFIHLVSDIVPFWFIRKWIFQLAGITIGSGSTIHMGVRFFEPTNIIIGEDTIIGFRSFLDGRDKLEIGDHVDIASEVMIYNSEHDINATDFHAILAPVKIGNYSFIGPRSIILPDVEIGDSSIIAAGAVVTKNIESHSIVGGIPAKTIGTRSKHSEYRLGRARLFQ